MFVSYDFDDFECGCVSLILIFCLSDCGLARVFLLIRSSGYLVYNKRFPLCPRISTCSLVLDWLIDDLTPNFIETVLDWLIDDLNI